MFEYDYKQMKRKDKSKNRKNYSKKWFFVVIKAIKIAKKGKMPKTKLFAPLETLKKLSKC